MSSAVSDRIAERRPTGRHAPVGRVGLVLNDGNALFLRGWRLLEVYESGDCPSIGHDDQYDGVADK